ncbi:hypothetical protein [Sphingomonas beigongshangi]|uniref:hypothetical protein n=1 Tax=Sphingomonas beigongshangi TaxID=2782540 RepID=UPI001FEE1570|nr:hypothetical protein [Sphingomonas beigongshangi]
MTLVPVEGAVLPAQFLTFDMVQERLVEAMITCWRLPDRERGLLRMRSKDGPWHLIMPDAADYDGGRGAAEQRADAVLRTAALTRSEVTEMEEAFGWVEMLTPNDRKLVALVIRQLARGGRQVAWRDLLRPMGLQRGADGLRMRYGRAINAICFAKNGSFACG